MKQGGNILILHGWNLNAEKFQPLTRELKENGYTVEAIDLPGFGSSNRPNKPYYLSDYVNFVDNYIASKKWKEVIIIGHSFGGRVSLKLASLNPQYLKALILTGTPGYNPVSKYKIVFFVTLAKIGNTIFSLPLLNIIQEQARRLLYKTARANDFYNTDKNMRDTFKNIVNENLEQYVSKISVPTLLIWGENDQITPLWIGKKMEKVMNNGKLEIVSNARHGVPWTHPKEFVQYTKDFLNKKIYE